VARNSFPSYRCPFQFANSVTLAGEIDVHSSIPQCNHTIYKYVPRAFKSMYSISRLAIFLVHVHEVYIHNADSLYSWQDLNCVIELTITNSYLQDLHSMHKDRASLFLFGTRLLFNG
jgi:hypothetical protein